MSVDIEELHTVRGVGSVSIPAPADHHPGPPVESDWSAAVTAPGVIEVVYCLAGESVERYFDEICSSSGSVQPVLSCLPSPPIEYLHVLQVLVLLPPEPGGGHPAHHRQLAVQGGHGVTSPGSGQSWQVYPP